MKKIVKSLVLTVFTLTLIASCDKSKDSSKSDPLANAAQMDEAAVEKANAEAKAERLKNLPENHLEIEGNDDMQYDLTELRVKAGKPVTLVLKHVGKASKIDMGHNWILLKEGVDSEDFAQKASKDVANNYIPASETASIIAHTKLLAGGESDTITFTIDKAGTYDFLCSFPAHHSMMKGKLIAE